MPKKIMRNNNWRKEMKKTMKTILIVLAIAMLASALVACVGTGSQTPPAQQAPPAQPAPETPNDGLTVEPGVLIMATSADFPPYEFWDGGVIVGIDAEIAGAIAEKLGLTLRIDDMDFSAILPTVIAGRADMAMAGLTVTEERMQSVDFSVSYATGIQVIIVREDSPITSVDDLFEEGAHHTIGVQEATTGDLYTTWDLEDEGLATIQRYRRGTDAVQSLVVGRVDAVVIDNEPARAFVALNPGLRILETEFAVEDYAIAFAKDNPLRDAVDAALRDLIADGTVQRIIEKYISAD